jgi:peptidyl-prolyl cis-trans isomerase A (cyclophilin A)
VLLIWGASTAVASGSQPLSKDPARLASVVVHLATQLGPITLELYPQKAPLSAAAFLAHVDQGLFAQAGSFYRAVRPDNMPIKPDLNLIQGGVTDEALFLPTIKHESTQQTGLSHTDGMVSLAREGLGTATGGTFFICIGDQSSLDDQGEWARKGDGQGHAVFGKVIAGMDVVRKIQQGATTHWPGHPDSPQQYMREPVRIVAAYRDVQTKTALP